MLMQRLLFGPMLTQELQGSGSVLVTIRDVPLQGNGIQILEGRFAQGQEEWLISRLL